MLKLKTQNLQVVRDHVFAAAAKKKASERSANSFCERFWHAAFGLRIWAMAKKMQAPLKAVLKRKLPAGAELKGPRLRPRGDATSGETLGWVGAGDDGSSTPGAHGDRSLPELPRGFTDMLRAEIVCKNEAALTLTFESLVDSVALSPAGGKSRASVRRMTQMPTVQMMSALDVPAAQGESSSSSATGDDNEDGSSDSEGGDGPDDMDFASGWSTTVRVEHVLNGFHASRSREVLPKAAGVLLMAVVTMKQRGPRGGATPVLEQLVEIELMLPWTEDARWLADFMRLEPSEPKPPTPPDSDRGKRP